MAQQRHVGGRLAWVSAYALRLALLLAVWWILTGSTGDWWFGFPLAVVAAAVSLWLTPPGRFRLRPLRMPAFAVYFLWQSLLAGWDVARRTLSPALPLHPEVVHLPLTLPPGAPTWWLMLIISLLPGTLSVRLHEDRSLEVHCLDSRLDIPGSVRETEEQIARLFGLHPGTAEGGQHP
jgi:multicomponent Na+:H+ antiporter subunit E